MTTSPLSSRINRLKKNRVISDVDLSIFIESYVHRYKLSFHQFMEEPIPWILTNVSVAVIADKKFKNKMNKKGE
jgi:hypothetical protein